MPAPEFVGQAAVTVNVTVPFSPSTGDKIAPTPQTWTLPIEVRPAADIPWIEFYDGDWSVVASEKSLLPPIIVHAPDLQAHEMLTVRCLAGRGFLSLPTDLDGLSGLQPSAEVLPAKFIILFRGC